MNYPELVTEEEKLKYYGLRNKESMQKRRTLNEARHFGVHQQPLDMEDS